MENLLYTDTKNKNIVFFCNYFKKNGLDVKFLTTVNEENKKIKKFADDVEIIHFPATPSFKNGTKKIFFPLKYLIKQRNNYDLIWCYLDRPSSFYSVMAKKFFGKRLMVKTDGSYPTKNRNLLKRMWKYFTVNIPLKNADFILTETSELKDEITKLNISGKIRVVPNGVPVKDFLLADKRIGKIERKNLMITVGRVEPYKGIRELIIAFKKFYLKNKNWKLEIVGPTNNKEYKKELDVLIKKLFPFRKPIVFLGPKFGDELFKIMKTAKIFCAVSLKRVNGDSFNNALPQGMFFGATPVISDAGLLYKQVEGLGIKQVNVENAEELFNALELAKNNLIHEKVLRNHVMSNFDWDVNLNKIKIPR